MKSKTILLLAPIASTHAFHPSKPSTTNHASVNRTHPTRLNLHASVEEAIAEAQQICAQNGSDSEACKVAWDIVEELEAADSHRDADAAAAWSQSMSTGEVNYLPLLEGMTVLSAKLDRKMDELNRLSRQLAEAGAGEEIEQLVYASEQMKGMLENANRKIEELKGY